jgi:hypothetical protein
MRSHDVSNFPDSNSSGLVSISGNSVNLQSAQNTAANNACQYLAYNGGGL